MKKIILLLLLVNILFANDGLKSIYENIILKNSKNAIVAAKDLENNIKETRSTKKAFQDLVVAWKKVEAFYILGDLNDEYLDTPRYIDIFHQGNEDITKQLDLALSSKDELKYALFKNSHKTINALEYILFDKNLTNERVSSTALIIIDKIKSNLEEIHKGYKKEKENFLKDEVSANAMMLNALIENSYKLKEWRVGDPAGLSRKFKDKPDNKRAEYSISKNSIVAIVAILHLQQMLLARQNYKNFGSMINAYGVQEELKKALKFIKLALMQSVEIKEDDFFEARALYKSLKRLHSIYYIALISKLKIKAKILDADGD